MSFNYSADQVISSMQENWPDGYSPNNDLAIYLTRVHDLGLATARKVLTRFNLSLGEFDILTTLRRTAPPHVLLPGQLQRSVLITSGGLTKLLYQLEDRGLISRSVREKDKRCKRVHLTAKGKRLVEKAMVEVQGAKNEWLNEALTQCQMKQLRDLLGKAARVLEVREGLAG